MKIEEGKFYVNVLGRKVGPITSKPSPTFVSFPFVAPDANTTTGWQRYAEYGASYTDSNENLVYEWVETTTGPIADPTNPKDSIGSVSLPVHLWPASATAYGCIGIFNGKCKYGSENFSATNVRATVYIDAALRHIIDWHHGHEKDPKDGVHNLAGALANLAILVEAMSVGTLIDDRKYAGEGWRVARDAMEPEVARLKEMHKERDPKNYTIKDRK